MILANTETTYKVVTKDNIQHCIQMHMVTDIVKKPHQLPMIKPSYHPKLMKGTNQACLPGPEQSFPVTHLSENDIQKLKSYIHDPLQSIQITKVKLS